MKRYKDFNHQKYNKKPIRGKKNPFSFLSQRSIVVIGSIAVLLFSIKIFAQPISSALAGLLKESSSSVALILNQKDLKQTDNITTVLLLGVDQREEGQTSLTDTIMLANYNHTTKEITMVSAPRDLWVTVPAFGEVYEHGTKINAVYSLGDVYEYSSDGSQGEWDGGIGLLTKVLEENIGIPIHYFALVNFKGFINIVDAVGGIDMYVENAFTDYEYPKTGYENAPWNTRWEVVTFEQGWQRMDGETALKYARSRHAYGPQGSDFARAARQQAVIIALKDKVLSTETLFNLNTLRQLFTTLSSEFASSIGITELPTFYNLYNQIGDFSNITSIVLTNDPSQEGGLLYQPSPEDYGGAFALIPTNGWDEIRTFVHDAIHTENRNETESVTQ
ncbi:LCP family protein [bacterium]|uniref:Cell envelope-related transcriptional attenuator domain-containing protein n=2 Tax=Katanobacteria TaxID=422282 RepID=A0A2M7X3S6_UNCKA|nr:LCP family protein [bacterium]PIP56255.1 MAG: hypothetical protein COX05_03915 [candidate division WWE3 bacterium CG22_combo_CG10-13_8_21_14_all_39_12]PJA40826.1 MAG: hypothetical protein CO179_01230 [candidate division WWE3 bacterium CG_4_9_14_3_um_filter_39_7]